MNLRLIFSLLLSTYMACSLSSCISEDPDSPRPEDLFVRYYGGAGTETTVDLDYLSSSDEYVLLSNSTSNDNLDDPTGLNDIYIVKTSDNGSIVDETFIDFREGTNLSDDIASCMRIFNDTIVVVGTVQIRESDLGIFSDKAAYYALLDTDLNIISADTIAVSGSDVEGNDITRTSDGNYVILMTVGDALSGQRDMMFKKVTPESEEVWIRTSELPGDDVGVSIIELENTDLAIAARTDRVSVRGFSGANVLYLTLNSLGFISNSLSYGTTRTSTNNIDDVPARMVKDGDGAIIVGSSSANDRVVPFILPLTSSAAVDSIRTVTIQGQNAGARFSDITRATNGDLLLTGRFLNYTNTAEENGFGQGNKGPEILFLRTDQLGTTNISVSHYGDSFDDSGNAIFQLPDGKVLIGATISFGGANTKIGLFKVNGQGELTK